MGPGGWAQGIGVGPGGGGLTGGGKTGRGGAGTGRSEGSRFRESPGLCPEGEASPLLSLSRVQADECGDVKHPPPPAPAPCPRLGEVRPHSPPAARDRQPKGLLPEPPEAPVTPRLETLPGALILLTLQTQGVYDVIRNNDAVLRAQRKPAPQDGSPVCSHTISIHL